jgi:hypothetical protein
VLHTSRRRRCTSFYDVSMMSRCTNKHVNTMIEMQCYTMMHSAHRNAAGRVVCGAKGPSMLHVRIPALPLVSALCPGGCIRNVNMTELTMTMQLWDVLEQVTEGNGGCCSGSEQSTTHLANSEGLNIEFRCARARLAVRLLSLRCPCRSKSARLQQLYITKICTF